MQSLCYLGSGICLAGTSSTGQVYRAFDVNYKPMLRGCQLGEYHNGVTSVTCTRFVDDFNWDTSGEYTGISSTAFDTLNNRLTLADTTYIYPTGLTTLYGVYHVWIKYVSNTAHITFLVANNSIEIDHAGAVIFNGGSAESWTVDVPSSIIKLKFIATGTQIAVYSNDVLKGTKTGLTLAASNYKMKIATANYYVYQFGFNSSESTSRNNIALSLGGVPHGARYDIAEYALQSFTNAARYGEYKMVVDAKTTNYSAEDIEVYLKNVTDNSDITNDASSVVAIALADNNYLNVVKDVTLNADDVGDTITVYVRRKTAATDNTPACFIDYLSLLPVVEI